MSAFENKVSETTFSEFSKISRNSTNFPEPENVLEMNEFEVVSKRLECVTKYEKFTSLTIHFSSQSDKYSTIYSPLKIKFFWRKFQNFQEFLEIKQISKTLKMSWNSWNLKFRWNPENYLSNYVLFSWIRQIFAHIIEIQKQVHKTRNKYTKQETSAKTRNFWDTTKLCRICAHPRVSERLTAKICQDTVQKVPQIQLEATVR